MQNNLEPKKCNSVRMEIEGNSMSKPIHLITNHLKNLTRVHI
jgi:hypothetical protein